MTEPYSSVGDVASEVFANGFAVMDRYLDAATVEHLVAVFERDECQRALNDRAGGNSAGPGQSVRSRRGSVFAARNILELKFVRAFAGMPKVRDLVEVICPGAVAVRGILFDKTGLANWTVPWHQDRSIAVKSRVEAAGYGPWSVKAGITHVQPPTEVLQRMITLRFALDACGADNGPLRVIPGTHATLLTQEQIEAIVAERPQVACVSKAGGVVMMRPMILHASSPAAAPSHRRVLHLEFGPKTLHHGMEWAFAD